MVVFQADVARSRTEFHSAVLGTSLLLVSDLICAQSSPFETGANSLVSEFIAIGTPIAIIAVMVLGLMALSGRISWGWPLLVLLGICITFGAPRLVDWARGLFGV